MIRLHNTSGGDIARAIGSERHRMGSPTTGMVLTMLILSDEEHQADATEAAVNSAREHPMRILTLVPRPGGDADVIDADITVGGDDGPGEVAVVRLRGDRSTHANSVVIPLLLPDTPIVAWWPSSPPKDLAHDPIGFHAQRRITDAAAADDPWQALQTRCRNYSPGDTDLAWTRLTPWRSVLAAMLDRHTAPIRSAHIGVGGNNPSAALLASWLMVNLQVEVTFDITDGPGITEVTLHSAAGDLRLTRSDGVVAMLSAPGVPDAPVALSRRRLAELLAEELRRLTPDEVYAHALSGINQIKWLPRNDASGG